VKLSIVVAIADNGVIGDGGGLPWRLPDELQYVKRLTMGHCLIMGRKTYESIGRPLPGRTSIVLTRDPEFAPDGVTVVRDFEAALDAARATGDDEAFVFGGASLYAMALAVADHLYLTRVHAEVAGDVRFPSFDGSRWRLVMEERHGADERHCYAFTFQKLDRIDRSIDEAGS
jgi:dihydrofolate reductase